MIKDRKVISLPFNSKSVAEDFPVSVRVAFVDRVVYLCLLDICKVFQCNYADLEALFRKDDMVKLHYGESELFFIAEYDFPKINGWLHYTHSCNDLDSCVSLFLRWLENDLYPLLLETITLSELLNTQWKISQLKDEVSESIKESKELLNRLDHAQIQGEIMQLSDKVSETIKEANALLKSINCTIKKLDRAILKHDKALSKK
jgi:hypothetical protein